MIKWTKAHPGLMKYDAFIKFQSKIKLSFFYCKLATTNRNSAYHHHHQPFENLESAHNTGVSLPFQLHVTHKHRPASVIQICPGRHIWINYRFLPYPLLPYRSLSFFSTFLWATPPTSSSRGIYSCHHQIIIIVLFIQKPGIKVVWTCSQRLSSSQHQRASRCLSLHACVV